MCDAIAGPLAPLSNAQTYQLRQNNPKYTSIGFLCKQQHNNETAKYMHIHVKSDNVPRQ